MTTESILHNLYNALRDDELPVSEISEDAIANIAREIDESIFQKKEGNKLALNILHYIYPDSCRFAAPGDFIGEAQEEVLNAIDDLPHSDLTVSHITTDGGNDWESLYDDEDGIYENEEDLEKNFTLDISFRVNGYPENISLSHDESAGPDPFFDKLAIILTQKHDKFKKTVLKTYTIWDVFDMDGAILICSLPESTANKVRKIIDEAT